MSHEIEAGRETDVLVAEKVMGWVVNRADGRHWHTVGQPGGQRQIGNDCCAGQHYDSRSFMPSRDRSAALEVVDRLTEAGLSFLVRMWNDEAEVEVHSDYGPLHADDNWATGVPLAAALPLAICRAALSPEVLKYLSDK